MPRSVYWAKPPNYELEIDLDTGEGTTLETAQLGLLSIILGTLLPAVEVKEVRETSSRPQPARFPQCWFMGDSPVRIALTKEHGGEVLAYDAHTGNRIPPADLARIFSRATEPGVVNRVVQVVAEEEFNQRLAELQSKSK